MILLLILTRFLLFGNNTANSIGHHNPESIFIYDGVISEDDIENIDYESQFKYLEHPKYLSKRK